MSKTNGDKARFHVTRKQNIKRRARHRELLHSLAVIPGTPTAEKTVEAPAVKAKKVG